MARTAVVLSIFVAMIVNTIVLVAPTMLIAGWAIFFQPFVLFVLLLMNLFVMAEGLSTSLWCMERDQRGRPADITARRLALVTGLTIVSIFWLALIRRDATTVFVELGVVMFLVGVGLRFLAVQQLRTSFRSDVSISVEQTLIRDGLYRHVRHPSETGLLLIALGAALMLGSLAAIAVWAIVLLPLVLVRIRLEEHSLRDAFGETYRRYAQDSASLMPGVY